MNDPNHLRSIARVLYTQNPFYLISCGFTIYGLQAATLSIGDMFSRGVVLSVALSAYAVLMAVTVIAVVRCGKVWDDARSIFLVVLISLVSLSVGLDELCVLNWNAAVLLLSCSFLFSVVTAEAVLHFCRIRFRLGYRLPLYAILVVFFAAPVVAGYALNQQWMGDRNWSAMLFSCAVAASMLLLVPAVRYGRAWTHGSGTPWSWPCYPLSLFVILIVLAGLRTHAIWMSFSADYLTVSFEPFLLMPIGLAILVLLIESDRRGRFRRRAATALFLAPALLLLSFRNDGQTFLPTRSELQDVFGSATTLCVAVVAVFYCYTWIRRVRGSAVLLIATLFAFGASQLPLGMAATWGAEGWMICVVALSIAFLYAVLKPRSDKRWFLFVTVSAASIAVAGIQTNDANRWIVASAASWLAGTMLVAAFSDTPLARIVRVCSATASVCLAASAVAWNLDQAEPVVSPMFLLAAGIVAMIYCLAVRRTGWLYVTAIQFACAIVLFIADGRENASWIAFVQSYWPIQVGMGSFLAGLSITSFKTGIHRQLGYQLRRHRRKSSFRKGF
tara:strand:- start:26746 stop:28422 length:1677 start_codon:yes stop_codon:yes gene_type:complete